MSLFPRQIEKENGPSIGRRYDEVMGHKIPYQNFIVYKMSEGQPVKNIIEEISNQLRILRLCFAVKSVHLVHVYRFVITASEIK